MTLDGHTLDEDGEHDEEACYQCLVNREPATSDCRCGQCCRRLIIEVSMEDAKREPRIKALGSPIKGFTEKVEGYLLNSRDDMACVFLDRATNLCTVYPTRPLICRLFDCGGEGKQQLIELGILER